MVNENHLSRYNTMQIQNQHLHNAFIVKLINSTNWNGNGNGNDNDDFPYSKFSTIWIKNLCVTKYSLFHKANIQIHGSFAQWFHREVCFLFFNSVHD